MTSIYPIPRQATRFSLPIAIDVRLVSMETARAVLGFTAETVTELAEDHLAAWPGEKNRGAAHLPAFDFNLGTKGKTRELRIWAGALRGAASPGLEAIIADCLLTDAEGLARRDHHLWSSQLERAWCLSNQKILRLIQAGEVRGVKMGRNWRVNRFSAAAFLRRRAV